MEGRAQGKRKKVLARESMWAYLPVGPLARQFWEGNQGGLWEEVPKNPQERVVAFLWRDIWGSLG